MSSNIADSKSDNLKLPPLPLCYVIDKNSAYFTEELAALKSVENRICQLLMANG